MAATEQRRFNWRIILACVVLLVLTTTGGWYLWRVSNLPVYGKDLTGVTIGGDFTLTDHTGREVKLSDYRGKVVVLFFWLHLLP